MQEDGDICLRFNWMYQIRWTFQAFLRLHETFALYCDDGTLNMDSYNHLVQQGYNLIIDDVGILTALYDNKIYPNDACPCGSGKKFKKCHGRVGFERNW